MSILQKSSHNRLYTFNTGGIKRKTCTFLQSKLILSPIYNLPVAMQGKLGLCGPSVVVFDTEFVDVAVH